MSSFQQLVELVYTMARRPDSSSVQELSRDLHLTPDQFAPIVQEARNLGLIGVSKVGLTLTAKGAGLAVEIEERVSALTLKAIPAYTPYLEYVPERWWP